MKLLTTTVRAYPKPSYVPISDWFTNPPDAVIAPTARRLAELAAAGDCAEALFVRAIGEAVRDQVEAGIDVPTDGEIRRENYIHYHCRHLTGIDFEQLAEHRMRRAVRAQLPTITGAIAPKARSFLVHDWRIAQAATDHPVKMTLPGPMTISDSLVDRYYGDRTRLGADLATALNAEMRALADAGCTHIQVDEPVLARDTAAALDHGLHNLVRCFDGLPGSVARIVHICCGYPDRLDSPDYPKAPNDAYLELAEGLDAAPIDQVSIEDAHRHNDLAQLLPRLRDTTVILGVLTIASSRPEGVDEIRDRIGEALGHIEAERLVIAPDCGLGFLGRDLSLRKFRTMTAAAQLVP